MSAGRKVNRKGRNVGTQPFVMLQDWIFDCPAYRGLKPGPRALLWEFIRRFNGFNNGRIGFGARDMSDSINVSDRQTIANYVRELEARGFIRARKRGGFNVKVADRRASEWILTMFPLGNELATKDFARWRPSEINGTEKPTSKDGKSAPEGSINVRPRPNMREIPSLKCPKPANPGAEIPSTYTSIAIAGGSRPKVKGKKRATIPSSSSHTKQS